MRKLAQKSIPLRCTPSCCTPAPRRLPGLSTILPAVVRGLQAHLRLDQRVGGRRHAPSDGGAGATSASSRSPFIRSSSPSSAVAKSTPSLPASASALLSSASSASKPAARTLFAWWHLLSQALQPFPTCPAAGFPRVAAAAWSRRLQAKTTSRRRRSSSIAGASVALHGKGCEAAEFNAAVDALEQPRASSHRGPERRLSSPRKASDALISHSGRYARAAERRESIDVDREASKRAGSRKGRRVNEERNER